MRAGSFLFVVGGARSGKSDFAVEAGRRAPEPVVLVATAQAGDDDMERRIERHQRDRPADWTVIEEPLAVSEAIERVDREATLILDCLTLWTSNLLLDGVDEDDAVARASALGHQLADRPGTSIVVSNEVGLGIHPETAIGRDYRDLLGRINRAVATTADTTLFFAAGLAIELRDPWSLVE